LSLRSEGSASFIEQASKGRRAYSKETGRR
jgi:hypothetical protein